VPHCDDICPSADRGARRAARHAALSPWRGKILVQACGLGCAAAPGAERKDAKHPHALADGEGNDVARMQAGTGFFSRSTIDTHAAILDQAGTSGTA